MSKEKKIPKEYAIVVSLMIFFTIVILVGATRIYLVTKDRLSKVDLATIDMVEVDTNIDIENYNLRIANSIRDVYDIDIYYGLLPGLESVDAIAVTDDTVIFDMLKELTNVLEQYPENLVKEMEKKGYEISIYLVDHFTTNVEALANRNSIGQMNIYISNTVDVARALHHEYYHILDYYIKLESDERVAYLDWDKYNPNDFKYTENIDNITAKYVYNGETGAYFVTPYAKYSEKEDRAETFAEMMTAAKDEIFFNENGPIKGKMNIINKVLYSTFESVRLEETLAWK
ncbi:MAG: hypothetical protein IJ272_01250 [Clostridia bacterium]|nr:hypothetical protein [Clostridia bacterium]